MMNTMPRTLGMIFLFILSSHFVSAQHESHTHQITSEVVKDLNDLFGEYDILEESLDDEVSFLSKNESIDIPLTYKSEKYKLYLYKNHLLSDSYVSRNTTNGSSNDNVAVTMSGYTNYGDIASITIAEDFLFGYFEDQEGGKIYIEPLRFHKKEAANEQFILYHEKHILDTTEGTCGTTKRHDLRRKLEGQKERNSSQNSLNACLEIELAIATDYSMFQKYGSISAVENHNIGVINDVQTNYISDFNDSLQFSIVEQFVVSCSGCDPWTSSNDAGALLGSFTNWGPNGFTQIHDMGELWTNRNLDGSTVGIAWLGAVCSNNRYHVLQDFTSNANALRVLVAHEMGHNFDASHDASGSPYIMAPAVQNTNLWSNQSKNQINSFVNTIDPPFGCLSNCPASAAPVVADFGSVSDNLCAGTSVQFFENASGPVATYNWSFPGGIPSSSTEPNPTVTFPGQGSYDVTLTVTDGGSDTDTKTVNSAISVGLGGHTIFEFEDFEDGTTGNWTTGGNQSWNITTESGVQYGSNTFMVNNFSSSGEVDLESPVIDLLGYDNPTINLNYAYTTRNGNSDSLVIYVSTDGGINFTRVGGVAENGTGNYATAPGTSGSFTPQDQSDWCYAGGNSCLSIPLTGAAHSQNVVVRVRNKSFGGNNLYIDYLYVASDCYNLNPPVAEFSADVQQACNDITVNFQDESLENPVAWNWDFPGGVPETSTEQNPTVYYAQPGTYSVQLIASNPEGSDTETKVDFIFVEGDPNAFFTYSVSGREVTFTNESTEAFTYAWDFGDGNSSTDENPVHTYSQDGTFTVTLTSSNNCGSDAHSEDIVIATPPVASFTASDSMGCQPLEVIFNANSSTNTTAYYWEFPGGTPSSSSQVVETVLYDSAGTFDVLFVASNANGHDTILLTDYITIDPLPEANFVYTPFELTVEFFNQSLEYDSIKWHFGDGTESTVDDPVHTYTNEGSYDVSLIAFNSCGNDTLEQTINVQEAVMALVTVDTNSGCAPITIDFDGSSSTGDSTYSWIFNGGNPGTSTQQSVAVTYDSPGVFNVTLIVSDGSESDTLVLTDFISILTGPSGNFNYSVNEREATFQLNASNYNSVEWDFGDGSSSTMENPVHEYDADGTYDVVLTLFNICDTIMVQEQVEIATPPTADFMISMTEGCIPLEVSFTNASSDNANSFVWNFEGGTPATSTNANPTVTYNTAGNFDVELIAFSNGVSDTVLMENVITVFPDPKADFGFTVDTTTVNFTNNSTNANSYLWDFGDGNTSMEVNPTHTYSTEGSYVVTLMAINDCDTNIFNREIGTASLPMAEFAVQGDPEGCASFTVQYMNQSMGTIDSYQWTFEGGVPSSSNEENPVITYSSTGIYDVSLIVTNSAGDNELVREDYIVVKDLASGSIDVTVVDSLTVNFDGTVMGGPGASVLWDFGDGNTNNQEDVLYTYQSAGTYEVLFIVSNECGHDTTTTEISVGSTSVVQERLKEIRLYPNPTQDKFTVDHLPLGALIKVVDQYGQQIFERNVNSAIMKIDAAAWTSGVYYLNVLHENENRIYRVIIQN